MSRRSLVATGVGAGLLLLLVLWLLWPTDPNADEIARPAPIESAATQLPDFAPPIDRIEAKPIADEESPPASRMESVEPAPPVAAGPKVRIDVGVITPDGEPLVPFLRNEVPRLSRISVVATREPLGDRLPESIAPFYSWMGLGTFDRPQRGNANLNPRVAGFIGTRQLPRAMPVYVNLSIGPVVIAS